MLSDTFSCDIFDGKLINFDKPRIIVRIIWAYLSTIDPNGDRQGFKDRSWLIERPYRIVDIGKGSHSIFIVVFRDKGIFSLVFGSQPKFDRSTIDDFIFSLLHILDKERQTQKQIISIFLVLWRENLEIIDTSIFIWVIVRRACHRDDTTSTRIHDHSRSAISTKIPDGTSKAILDKFLDIMVDREGQVDSIDTTIFREIKILDNTSPNILFD